jgi:hypothetical protein
MGEWNGVKGGVGSGGVAFFPKSFTSARISDDGGEARP